MSKLIHIGRVHEKRRLSPYLYLRERAPDDYMWYEEDDRETGIGASSAEEALRLAHRQWDPQGFRTVICGFRYSLPERDEHGLNALFHEMAASYSTMTGIYFDESLGHQCYVQNASQEALELWHQLKEQNRL